MSQWNSYYKKLANKPPRPLLIKALSYANNPHKEALDIGAGALNDTKYLLDEGWSVLAIDSSKEFLEYANSISHPKFKAINLPIEQYEFDRTFSLINAQFALPFIEKNIFTKTFNTIKGCLEAEGIFCGQFFGINDEWNTSNTSMTFLTKEEIEKLLQGMKIIQCNEVEEDGETAAGTTKHWHVYHVIARKQ